jgi:hypothetical protein
MRWFDRYHGAYKSCEYKEGLSDAIKNLLVPLPGVYMPGQANDATQVDSSLYWTPHPGKNPTGLRRRVMMMMMIK